MPTDIVRHNSEESGSEADLLRGFDGSNAIRLSPREWIVTALIVMAVIVITPPLWSKVEPLDQSADYRLPEADSEDYWQYKRLVENTALTDRILIIGDSVIWGEYVDRRNTLSGYLNAHRSDVRFVNGGVNGSHPLALEGLVQHYAAALRDRPVILHCNLLWMSSPERDLQTEKEVDFNHPRLIPQFMPNVPSYHASPGDRMGVIVDRTVPFRSWVAHMRITQIPDNDGNLDLPSWSLDHPYDNPFSRLRQPAPEPSENPHHSSISWVERGIDRQDFPWVDLESSLQWRAFRNTVELLRQRGNRVFVVVGPFNEHLLANGSRKRYRQLKQSVKEWLHNNAVACYVPEPLPSDDYADASHPISRGYRRLAEQMDRRDAFRRWLKADSGLPRF